MSVLDLGTLPDRTPAKLTIASTPDLAADLELYTRRYRYR